MKLIVLKYKETIIPYTFTCTYKRLKPPLRLLYLACLAIERVWDIFKTSSGNYTVVNLTFKSLKNAKLIFFNLYFFDDMKIYYMQFWIYSFYFFFKESKKDQIDNFHKTVSMLRSSNPQVITENRWNSFFWNSFHINVNIITRILLTSFRVYHTYLLTKNIIWFCTWYNLINI